MCIFCVRHCHNNMLPTFINSLGDFATVVNNITPGDNIIIQNMLYRLKCLLFCITIACKSICEDKTYLPYGYNVNTHEISHQIFTWVPQNIHKLTRHALKLEAFLSLHGFLKQLLSTSLFVCVRVYVCVRVCVNACVYTCVSVCTHVSVCVYVYIHVYVCLCVFVNLIVSISYCTHTYKHTH